MAGVLAALLLAAMPQAAAAAPTAFQQESAMSPDALLARWAPYVKEASVRFAVPAAWIRAVMMIESGGRTTLAEGVPITSAAGAMGLMQLMPATWALMRGQYGLGADPYDPRDNILAGTAVLRALYASHGYPGMFAAYNDGPGMLEVHRQAGEPMPDETINYMAEVAHILRTGHRSTRDGPVDPRAVDSGPVTDTAGEDAPPLPLDYPEDEDFSGD